MADIEGGRENHVRLTRKIAAVEKTGRQRAASQSSGGNRSRYRHNGRQQVRRQRDDEAAHQRHRRDGRNAFDHLGAGRRGAPTA